MPDRMGAEATRTSQRGVTTLVTGGARSGKSRYAEQRAARDSAAVIYVATSPPRTGDADWQQRIERHRARRPATWRVVETADAADVLESASAGDVVLVDCLGGWVTNLVDSGEAWTDGPQARALVCDATDALLASMRQRPDLTVYFVTNEVGSSVVPSTSAGNLFRDLLGEVNTRVSNACDEAVLMVAGRPIALPDPIAELLSATNAITDRNSHDSQRT